MYECVIVDPTPAKAEDLYNGGVLSCDTYEGELEYEDVLAHVPRSANPKQSVRRALITVRTSPRRLADRLSGDLLVAEAQWKESMNHRRFSSPLPTYFPFHKTGPLTC